MLRWVKNVLSRVVGVRLLVWAFTRSASEGQRPLALLGVPAHVIMVFGRWHSLCYQLYTRTSEKHLRDYMSLMAIASTEASTRPATPLFGGLSLNQAAAISEGTLDNLPRFVAASRAPRRGQA